MNKKPKLSNLIILGIIALLLIPQTRKPIQVLLHKGIALIVKPSVVEPSKRRIISTYNWNLNDVNTDLFDFSSTKGKVIVLNFWATWCPPCIAEMPSLEALYQRYKSNENVVFLFVSNEDMNVIQEFMTSKSYTFPAYQPLTNYPPEFNVTSIPRTFIINGRGEFIIDKTGAADWNDEVVISTIDKLLTEF